VRQHRTTVQRPMAKLAHSSVVHCSILTTLRRFPIVRVGSSLQGSGSQLRIVGLRQPADSMRPLSRQLWLSIQPLALAVQLGYFLNARAHHHSTVGPGFVVEAQRQQSVRHSFLYLRSLAPHEFGIFGGPAGGYLVGIVAGIESARRHHAPRGSPFISRRPKARPLCDG
jgi:hypothetical protein